MQFTKRGLAFQMLLYSQCMWTRKDNSILQGWELLCYLETVFFLQRLHAKHCPLSSCLPFLQWLHVVLATHALLQSKELWNSLDAIQFVLKWKILSLLLSRAALGKGCQILSHESLAALFKEWIESCAPCACFHTLTFRGFLKYFSFHDLNTPPTPPYWGGWRPIDLRIHNSFRPFKNLPEHCWVNKYS